MQTYKINDIKLWGGDKSVEPSDDGSYMMSLAIEGESEPVDHKSDVVPEADRLVKGDIVDYKTAKGQMRRRLVTASQRSAEDAKQRMIVRQTVYKEVVQMIPDHEDLNKLNDMVDAHTKVIMEEL